MKAIAKLLHSWGVATNGAIMLYNYNPTCHAYCELRTKNENRRTKDKQKSTDEGRKAKIKDENRRTKIALLGHRTLVIYIRARNRATHGIKRFIDRHAYPHDNWLVESTLKEI